MHAYETLTFHALHIFPCNFHDIFIEKLYLWNVHGIIFIGPNIRIFNISCMFHKNFMDNKLLLWIPVVLCLRLIERYMQCLLRTWYRYYLLLLHFDGEYTICDYGCAKATVVWDESSSNDKLNKSIRYVINNKYCVLHCVLSARLWIDTWIHHGTSRLKLAHVQLVFIL